ncbi:retropepsin-like aspartic protease [soil metagenome]
MVTRRMLIAGAGSAAVWPFAAQAQDRSFDSEDLHRGRATVPVFLNDRGPFQFMVDTAANASVIAGDLVEPLQLASLGNVGMNTLVGREIVPAVRVDRMRTGVLDAQHLRLAVGWRRAMAGLDGLLGCDLLADRKLILTFRGSQRARIARSSAPPRGFLGRMDVGVPMVVAGERRFGNLLMVPARIGRASAVAIIDSGAEGTILNRAAAVAGRCTPLTPGDGQTLRRVQSPTGEFTTGQAMLLPSLELATTSISDLAVAVGDFHSFDVWGLADQPAMLIGLDVLRLFGSVHIDLKRSELSLRA